MLAAGGRHGAAAPRRCDSGPVCSARPCSASPPGIPFAYAFTRAQQIRRDAPALATGFVNSCATLAILVGAPLLGFTFALPGEGAIGFAVVAVLWAADRPI